MAFSLSIKHEADWRFIRFQIDYIIQYQQAMYPQMDSEGQPIDIYPYWYPAGRAYFFQKQFPGDPPSYCKGDGDGFTEDAKSTLGSRGAVQIFPIAVTICPTTINGGFLGIDLENIASEKPIVTIGFDQRPC